jgi:hypothetical protein
VALLLYLFFDNLSSNFCHRVKLVRAISLVLMATVLVMACGGLASGCI